MSKWPLTLNLGGWPWTVRRRKLSGAHGESCGETRTLTLNPGQNALHEADTFVHELLHSILRSQGREYNQKPEEMYVSALASGLCGAIRSNPDLLPCLMENLK